MHCCRNISVSYLLMILMSSWQCQDNIVTLFLYQVGTFQREKRKYYNRRVKLSLNKSAYKLTMILMEGIAPEHQNRLCKSFHFSIIVTKFNNWGKSIDSNLQRDSFHASVMHGMLSKKMVWMEFFCLYFHFFFLAHKIDVKHAP